MSAFLDKNMDKRGDKLGEKYRDKIGDYYFLNNLYAIPRSYLLLGEAFKIINFLIKY